MVSMRDLAGSVQLTTDTIEPALLRMTVKANSAAETGKGFGEKDSVYKINRLSAGGGTVKAKDEMKLSFDVVANKY
jgi:hypothetical protein